MIAIASNGKDELANILTGNSRVLKSTEVQLEQILERRPQQTKPKRKKLLQSNSCSPEKSEKLASKINNSNKQEIWRYGRHKPSEEEKKAHLHKEAWSRIKLEEK